MEQDPLPFKLEMERVYFMVNILFLGSNSLQSATWFEISNEVALDTLLDLWYLGWTR